MRIAAVILLLCTVGLAFSADAKTEKETFDESMPREVKLYFALFDGCALGNFIGPENSKLSFKEVSKRIKIICASDIAEAEGFLSLSNSGKSKEEIRRLVQHRVDLSLIELRLKFRENKPVPGEEPKPYDPADPLDARNLLKCNKEMGAFISEYMSCLNNAFRHITPLSDESSDIVTEAILGQCERVIVSHRASHPKNCVGSSIEDADRQFSRAKNDERAKILAAVVQFRIEAKKLERSRQPPPAPAPTSERSL